MEVKKINNSGSWYAFKIIDGDEKISVYQPKCRCMSCEYLYIIVEDEDGERKYDLYPYGNGDQRLDDMINLVCKFADIIGKDL